MRTLKALVSLPQRYLIGATSTRLAGSHNKVDARKRPSWLWGIFAVTLLI